MTHRNRTRRSIARVGLIAFVVVAMSGLTAPAAEATGISWKYTLSVTGSPAAGAQASFSVVIKNKSFLGILNSVDLPVPPAYSVTGATTSRGVISRIANLVKLRNLLVLPGKTVTVTIATTVPCSSGGLSSTWSASNVKGLFGIPFSLDLGGSSRTTTVTARCYLKFISHPQDSAPGEPIPGGEGPVSVGLFSGADSAITSGASVLVTVGIGVNPSDGELDGDIMNGTTAGVASFTDLSIDLPGEGYTLAASAPNFNGATSDPFTVAGLIVQCEAGQPCSGSVSDQTGTAFAEVSSPPGSAGVLTAFFTSEEFLCDDYVPFSPSTLVFNVTSEDRGMQVKLSFDPGYEYVNAQDTEVCLESASTFLDRDGELVSQGLLPDCFEDDHDSYTYESDYDDVPVAPCVLARGYDDSGRVFTEFITAPGDPRGRH